MRTGLKVLLIYAIFITSAVFVYSATTQTTTMTWVVPSAVAHTLSYPGNCSQNNIFFIEDQCTIDSDVDGNAAQCLPYDDAIGSTVCQSAGLNGLLITNTGNVTSNIDINIVSDDFSGVDLNLVLKIWMSDGAGCGASGLGGWEFDCSIAQGDTTTAVTSTTCRNLNQFNETTGGRLITNLLITDTNGLCLSGDFNAGPDFIQGGPGGVSQGEHTITGFTTTGIAS